MSDVTVSLVMQILTNLVKFRTQQSKWSEKICANKLQIVCPGSET